MPKAGTHAYPHDELQQFWETAIQPLFSSEDLVWQGLVRLTGSGIVSKLNAALAAQDGARRLDFRGSFVADVEYGMVVEDMQKSQWPSSGIASCPSC